MYFLHIHIVKIGIHHCGNKYNLGLHTALTDKMYTRITFFSPIHALVWEKISY